MSGPNLEATRFDKTSTSRGLVIDIDSDSDSDSDIDAQSKSSPAFHIRRPQYQHWESQASSTLADVLVLSRVRDGTFNQIAEQVRWRLTAKDVLAQSDPKLRLLVFISQLDWLHRAVISCARDVRQRLLQEVLNNRFSTVYADALRIAHFELWNFVAWDHSPTVTSDTISFRAWYAYERSVSNASEFASILGGMGQRARARIASYGVDLP